MTTLQLPSAKLDASAQAFIARFLTHVAALSGDGKQQLATISRIETLLLLALAHRSGAFSDAWSALYRAIDDLVGASIPTHRTRNAHAYFRAFIRENGDLAP